MLKSVTLFSSLILYVFVLSYLLFHPSYPSLIISGIRPISSHFLFTLYPFFLILISYHLCIRPISFSSLILYVSVPSHSYLYPLCIRPILFSSFIRSISFLYFILYKSVLSHSHLLSYMYPSHLIPIFYPLCIRPISFPSFILYVSVTSHSHLCFSFSARMNREEKLREYRLGRETEEDRMWRRRREWIERRI